MKFFIGDMITFHYDVKNVTNMVLKIENRVSFVNDNIVFNCFSFEYLEIVTNSAYNSFKFID